MAFVEDPARVEQLRPHVRAPFLESFDQGFYEEFGRWPLGSPKYGQRSNAARLEKVKALMLHGATEGERAAAETAFNRMTGESQQHRATMDRLDSETYD